MSFVVRLADSCLLAPRVVFVTKKSLQQTLCSVHSFSPRFDMIAYSVQEI